MAVGIYSIILLFYWCSSSSHVACVLLHSCKTANTQHCHQNKASNKLRKMTTTAIVAPWKNNSPHLIYCCVCSYWCVLLFLLLLFVVVLCCISPTATANITTTRRMRAQRQSQVPVVRERRKNKAPARLIVGCWCFSLLLLFVVVLLCLLAWLLGQFLRQLSCSKLSSPPAWLLCVVVPFYCCCLLLRCFVSPLYCWVSFLATSQLRSLSLKRQNEPETTKTHKSEAYDISSPTS